MKGKDVLSINDLTREDIHLIINEALEMKTDGWSNTLDRKVLALIFEKPSLRTRTSFELAMHQLGGKALYLSPDEVGIGKRESIEDVARVLSRYVDVIAARTFAHSTVVKLAEFSSVPVVNALSDLEHPCQALADLLTIYEKKATFKDINIAYIGDGNNVAHSLMLAATLAGANFRIATPKGYEGDQELIATAEQYASENDGELLFTDSPELAARDADVLYTDVWTSMGQEEEEEFRQKVFAGYQINKRLLALAKPDCLLMHPLPAHHGKEVEVGILDTPQSVIFDQAENRLHAQKALLSIMLGGLEIPLPEYR